ncbi:MAG: TrmB family transcriptional regulator [Euryarchaeota archaeon]|nr:TrmB family transcriptional regulator [Euryarchaeota archaeon]
MVVDRRLVELLRRLGLSEYEARTYLALVQRGSATVREIRELAGIPYAREYDVLESLERRGYVLAQPGRPRRYLAVAPQEVLERELESIRRAVEELSSALSRLYSAAPDGESLHEAVWVIRGRQNIVERCRSMVNTAEAEVLLMGSNPVACTELVEALGRAATRGVRIRALGDFSPEARRMLEEAGVEHRRYTHEHSCFLLVDQRELILSAGDPLQEESAIYNRSRACIKLYRSYFEHVWEEKV